MQQTKVYSLNFLTPLPVSQCFRKENKQTKKKAKQQERLNINPTLPNSEVCIDFLNLLDKSMIAPESIIVPF